jgi:tRNA pseudouridine38-40 synthase
VSTFKLTVAYDGTGMVGWQRQAAGTSVQGVLEDALSDLDGRPVAATGAGRTDAGVHARAQIVGVTLTRSIEGDAVVRALNVRLPLTIRVLDATEVADTFHARFDARSKEYRYRIWNADVVDPFERLYVWHVLAPLDRVAMAQAALVLQGRHDFAAFQGIGTDVQSTEREILFSRVTGGTSGVDAGPLITYDVSGDGFLRHMVRNIVGTLVEIGRGKRPPGWMAEVLASRNRAEAGVTAPPEGLFLMRVIYGATALAAGR